MFNNYVYINVTICILTTNNSTITIHQQHAKYVHLFSDVRHLALFLRKRTCCVLVLRPQVFSHVSCQVCLALAA